MITSTWIYCPICGSKTHNKMRNDTILLNFPLFCPKCKQETLITVRQEHITVIKEPDALDAEPMNLWDFSQIIGSIFYNIDRAHPPNKKTVLWWAVLSCPTELSPQIRFAFGGIFLCAGLIPPRRRLYWARIASQKNPRLHRGILRLTSRSSISAREKYKFL